MNLTKNFTLAELTFSQEAARSGLRNDPTQSQLLALKALCENVLQPLRDKIRRPIVVTSGFRSRSLNTRIGGSKASQHMRGEAADILVPGMEVAEVIATIRKLGLQFDQVIDEFGRWTHVSYGPRHRRQVLEARLEGGKTVYQPYRS